MMRDILILYGPSGVGKSTLASAFAARHSYQHFELDQCGVDAVNEFGLRAEWDDYYNQANARSLCEELIQRARANGKEGAVLSLPSLVVPSLEQLHSALAHSATPVILYGSKEDCMRSFANRERASGRNLPLQHWLKHNEHLYDFFSREEYRPYLLEVFKEGLFLSLNDLLVELKRRHTV